MNEEINTKVHFWKKPKITVLETTGETQKKNKKTSPLFPKIQTWSGKEGQFANTNIYKHNANIKKEIQK